MKVKGKLKGKELTLERELGIQGEVDVEVEISFPEDKVEAFGIWKDRDDIRDSIEWVRNLREKEWHQW
ncbi:MAG: hypothetical protein COS88_01520 [Chloroflexi bacterium CG07_land_8_20_14_0_80_51_10]|nr:MAG: hypothetical protein COS88_01520 [Chloroflexi bacterium CG07_land_8_20_14_0_80_51_10]